MIDNRVQRGARTVAMAVLAIVGAFACGAESRNAANGKAPVWSFGPNGLSAFEMSVGEGRRNVIDAGQTLGRLSVKYLDAAGYLERAYRTAMAYFEVPYNIRMGDQWAFHGWCDWAYKQGNFHERYIVDVIAALEENGRRQEADRLRREWEKKVAYMVYEDPWPFGSEMFVDRTAFESSYYVAEYAFTRTMEPQEKFWFDKNSKKWHSYAAYPLAARRAFMANQLAANLAMRATLEPDYWSCGSPWGWGLDYMAQMGGVAILDYATRFAERPADYVRYGYNSLLSSWSLVRDGAGCYVVNDPVFGEIAYGGRLKADAAAWHIMPWDGVRRYLAIPQSNRFEMKLGENGWAKGAEVTVTRDFGRISFTLERRTQAPCERLALVNLPSGDYEVICDGRHAAFRSDGKRTEVPVPLKGVVGSSCRVEIQRRKTTAANPNRACARDPESSRAYHRTETATVRHSEKNYPLP